jgi:protoporphyrinogen/coproporphyrinogen III oxidase
MGARERPRLVVVGGGVAGLAAAHAALDAVPGLDVRVLERSHRVGGLVETEHTAQGYLVEHGADCLVTAKPAGMEVAERLGLVDDVVTGTGTPRAAFLVRRGHLVRLPPGMAFGIPSGAWAILRSPVLSLPAKLRMAFEPLIPRSMREDDESVAAFIERRFGRELLDRVIEPLLGGIHGAPATELSLRACLPHLHELERLHGSVVRGMRQSEPARKTAPGTRPLPPVVSLRRGMESLPRALARPLGDRIHCGAAVTHIDRLGSGRFRLTLEDGATLQADAVVVAAPAHAAAPMVQSLSPALATLLAEVRHRPVSCVSLGWPRARVPHPLEGTGFVVPAREGRATRACTWASAKWPGRAPEDAALLRSVIEAPEADEADMVALARDDLRDLLGIEAAPSLVRVRRRALGLPVYDVGYTERLDSMRTESAALGAFALAGNAQGGIGVADCIDSGRQAALTALGRLGSHVWSHDHARASTH